MLKFTCYDTPALFIYFYYLSLHSEGASERESPFNELKEEVLLHKQPLGVASDIFFYYNR
jgi:hypothetical protein